MSLPVATPLLVVPASNVLARQVSATHAELALTNDVALASVGLDADQLGALVDQLSALRDALDPAPAATPALHLPGAGLVLP